MTSRASADGATDVSEATLDGEFVGLWTYTLPGALCGGRAPSASARAAIGAARSAVMASGFEAAAITAARSKETGDVDVAPHASSAASFLAISCCTSASSILRLLTADSSASILAAHSSWRRRACRVASDAATNEALRSSRRRVRVAMARCQALALCFGGFNAQRRWRTSVRREATWACSSRARSLSKDRHAACCAASSCSSSLSLRSSGVAGASSASSSSSLRAERSREARLDACTGASERSSLLPRGSLREEEERPSARSFRQRPTASLSIEVSDGGGTRPSLSSRSRVRCRPRLRGWTSTQPASSSAPSSVGGGSGASPAPD